MVMLGAGRYKFNKPVHICSPITFCGEGAATEITPPGADFAIKAYHDGRYPHRGTVSFRTQPAHAKPRPSWENGVWGWGNCNKPHRLHGVHIRDLAIQGDGRGKGIFLSHLAECSLRELWIMNTADGAAST